MKIVETGSTPAFNGNATKQFVWCESTRCEERDGSGAVTKQFFDRGQKNSSSPYSYSKDHLGSVREMTDGSAAVQAQYSYTPFGERTKIAGSGPEADFGFAGMYHHERSGLNLTMFRPYDSRLGRWLSRDPLGESAGVNLYAYVGNNPINFVDPLGLSAADVQRLIANARSARDEIQADYQAANPGELSNILSSLHIPNFKGCADQSDLINKKVQENMFPEVGPQKPLDDQWTMINEHTPSYSHTRSRFVSSNPLDPDIIVDSWKRDIAPAIKGWDAYPNGIFTPFPFSEQILGPLGGH